MASTKSVARGVRLANDCAEYFEGKPLNKMIEGMMRLLLSGELTFDGVNLRIGKSFKKDEIYADLEEMVELCGSTMDEFLKEMDRCLNEGELTIFEGKLVCVLPEWAEKLSDACHELGYDVEKIADSAVKSLKHGML